MVDFQLTAAKLFQHFLLVVHLVTNVGAGVTKCSADQFECASGGCLSAAVRCNGLVNCGDASDERGCPDVCTSTGQPSMDADTFYRVVCGSAGSHWLDQPDPKGWIRFHIFKVKYEYLDTRPDLMCALPCKSTCRVGAGTTKMGISKAGASKIAISKAGTVKMGISKAGASKTEDIGISKSKTRVANWN